MAYKLGQGTGSAIRKFCHVDKMVLEDNGSQAAAGGGIET